MRNAESRIITGNAKSNIYIVDRDLDKSIWRAGCGESRMSGSEEGT